MLIAALLSCGDRPIGATRGGDSGTTPDRADSRLGGGSGGGSGVGGSDGGAAGGPGRGGAGGTGAAVEGPSNISGRWGLFTFEDPVGVLLVQAPDGRLTGRGCAAGAPGSTSAAPQVPPVCGDISGRVTGRSAWFSFETEGIRFLYSARVTVSTDGARMTGALSTTAGDIGYPIAWLRVRDDLHWLERSPSLGPEHLTGLYELTLIANASTGNAFAAGRSYRLFHFQDGLGGDLGSFWSSEMTDARAGSPLRTGPVSATVPELPISLTLDFGAAGFTGVSATTASGESYQFTAKKLQ
jgi:hypothetical protein